MNTLNQRARKRYFSAMAVSALGVCTLAIPLYDMWDDVSDLNWGFVGTVVENSPMLLLSLCLVGAGYWLATSDAGVEYVTTVAKWNVGVVAVVCGLYAWVVLLQLWSMGTLKPWVLALDGILFSSVVALGVGVYNAEREQYRTDLERREQIHRSLTEDVLDTSDVAIVVLDESRAVVWANRAMETYFGVDPEDVVGRDAHAVVAESIAPTLTDPEGFRSHVEALHGTDETGKRECRVDGPDAERWLEHRSKRIETGLYEGGRIEYFTNITEQKRAQQELKTRERKFREMYDVISSESLSMEEKIGAIVDAGRELLDADYGVLSRVEPDADTYHAEVVSGDGASIEAGETVPSSETWCQRTVSEAETLQFETRLDDADEAAYGPDAEFEMYVGTPIYEGDDLYGTLCFLDRDPRTPFSDWELTMIELVGNWVSYELQRTHLRDELRHRVQDREEKLASFIDAVDEYAIFRIDSDHRITSWNSGAEETTGYDRSEILGERLDVFFEGRDVAPDRLLERAAERGKLTHQSWWERRDGRTFWADVTISAETVGSGDPEFVVIVRDMTDEREYERTIETERERLEFLNRVLRHNLLNSLNVVHGRVALVDDNDPADIDVDEHVGTARRRIDDMIELIERMRTFTDAIIDDEDHDLYPTSLNEAVERKTEMLGKTHDEAHIAVDLPPEETSVLADPLLGAVVENVVSNAIVHNDSADPRVHVSTSETEVTVAVDDEDTIQGRPDERGVPEQAETVEHPAITVHVADDGPGIPDDEKSAVLQKGISRLSEPGNGFGLFLVKEMMETYLGEIRIRDNDPEGTVVDLTFLVGTAAEERDKRTSVVTR